MKATSIPIDLITIDHETQSRADTNRDTVAEYAEAWRSENEFPPVDLFSDGTGYHVGDGVHRILSAKEAGRSSVPACVHQGGKHEASIFACGANKSHGLKRTNADKRKCVERMLRLEAEWADNRIAAHVGVSQEHVRQVRAQLTTVVGSDVNPPTRVGSDGKRRTAPKPAVKETPPATASAPMKEPDPIHPIDVVLADPWWQDACRTLAKLGKQLDERFNDPLLRPHMESFTGRVLRELKAIRSTLRAATPADRCGKCRGKGCSTCLQTGLLVYGQANREAKR
jgi:hypothetical protein